jgi:CubicO group peptidase (beta-lactamase class C family)
VRHALRKNLSLGSIFLDRVSVRSSESFGWSGAFGTHFWVNPKEEVVGILMTQTSNGEIRNDFEMAVMPAIME